MFGWESHVPRRHYLEQHYSVTAIASELGCDRRTACSFINRPRGPAGSNSRRSTRNQHAFHNGLWNPASRRPHERWQRLHPRWAARPHGYEKSMHSRAPVVPAGSRVEVGRRR